MGLLSRLLLDTHALLWLDAEPNKIPESTREAVSDPQSSIFVSAASAYEISLKNRTGKLPGAERLIEQFANRLAAYRFQILDITSAHAIAAGRLDLRHRDPFDRLLIAQALGEDLTLVSNEKLFESFGVRRLW